MTTGQRAPRFARWAGSSKRGLVDSCSEIPLASARSSSRPIGVARQPICSLPVGDPISVEAKGYAYGKFNYRQRLTGKVLSR
jgi:hypothetical protein